MLLLALLFASPTQALRPQLPTHAPCFVPLEQFRDFSEQVWEPSRWKRSKPKHVTLVAYRRMLACAGGPGHRAQLRRIWRRQQAGFFEHRRDELWRVRVTPFYGGGRWWALPYLLVVCESGADYSQTYGAYSILDPAWREWGGQTAHAGEASKREQDRVAHVGWGLYGESAWECKSDGSTSWP